MAGTLIISVPRSGSTVYLNQSFDRASIYDEVFDKKFYSHEHGPRYPKYKFYVARLRSEVKNNLSYVVKQHPHTTIDKYPDWFPADKCHTILFLRRNIFEQTLSYALARDKLLSRATSVDTVWGGHKDALDYHKFFKPGDHENTPWYISTKNYPKYANEILWKVRDLIKNYRYDEIVWYEDHKFKEDALLQRSKSETISNIDELKEIWLEQISGATVLSQGLHIDELGNILP